ncbi:MAG: glycine cleavage system protein GcvH [Acidimicrobiia bacterium]|nr:glycine cleavage system protein GcvH [Acidimicrobiia bacterium]MBT8250606.1 glycine cleavage system protein GcvH [Acidimicrobiia bacterium]NND14030.1 glycine cleavage system protein GcvH [Acidimicrobiia bacterium]NNL28770.1 glycine cleavage system protein GcvH [Acidimicrobiia bacterium]NNL48947.1 glycine cleavage system protein GcvH [Acidimicrobiia bacterium]
MELDQNARYATTHEWARQEDDLIVVGISDHAQDSMSDIVYVELPDVGDTMEQGEEFGVVESAKAVSDVYMPVSGEIVEVNTQLDANPEKVNISPYQDGWMIKIRPSDPDQMDALMTPDAYQSHAENA